MQVNAEPIHVRRECLALEPGKRQADRIRILGEVERDAFAVRVDADVARILIPHNAELLRTDRLAWGEAERDSLVRCARIARSVDQPDNLLAIMQLGKHGVVGQFADDAGDVIVITVRVERGYVVARQVPDDSFGLGWCDDVPDACHQRSVSEHFDLLRDRV